MKKIAAFFAFMVPVAFMVRAQTTLHVPGSYATIQAAVNAASHPLDVIQVAAGNYAAGVSINKSSLKKG